MLPTSGLFKDIDCPFYDNFCGRPYCHFRHRKKNNPDSTEDSQDGEITSAEFPTYNPTPKSQLAQAKSHIPISYVPDTVIRPDRVNRITPMYHYTDKITYKPTPLSELSKNNAINTLNTAELFNIGESKTVENAVTEDSPELRDNDNCDIDFEELSTEFDMIDDIINETPSVETEEHVEVEVKQSKADKKQENFAQESKSKSLTRSSNNSKSSSSKTSKEGKSKQSKPSSSHKSSTHRSKATSDRSSRSSSKEQNKDKSSNSKSKEDKKPEKDNRKSSSTSTASSRIKKESDSKNSKDKREKSKDSKRSSSNSSKHKEYDKSKKKEKEKSGSSSSKEKHKRERKISENKEIAKYQISDDDKDDLFDEDLEEECYRIFNEYKPEIVQKHEMVDFENQQQQRPQDEVEEYVPMSKKRVAHMGADQYISKLTHNKLKPVHNAALQMASRYKIAREAHVSEENDIVLALNKHGVKRQNLMLESYKNMKKVKTKCDIPDGKVKMSQENKQSNSLIDDIINGRNAPVTYKPTPIAKLNAVEEVKSKPVKIAPAMNAFSMQQAKARMIAEMAKKKDVAQKTPVQTMSKGNKRVAHIPDSSLGELPDVLQPDNKKIPVNVRTRYLTMIADECVKLYLSREDAYNRALNEELKVLERCAAIVTYRNSAMLAVNRIRKELQDRETKGLGPISSGESTVSSVETNFKGRKFYTNITQYVLKEEDLLENGYPREGPIAGKAVIKCQKQLPRVNLDENQRLCCRCFKVYLVDVQGFPLYNDDCIYHPLKKRTLKGERLYLCCKSTEDTGCMTAISHVSESDDTELLGYQATMDPESDVDVRSWAVYALDCEMCYTTKGLELTRVTIIDPDCKTVYESLVKPLNPIMDYNTQFSGITKEQMDRTSTSILQVQANILHLCNSKTILIGHSLESDMKALKIIHSCIIDTAILFPHRLGPPHKRALRTLASEFLNKIIQSDVGGHDSAEDAISCMELVIWKLKEDLKVKGTK